MSLVGHKIDAGRQNRNLSNLNDMGSVFAVVKEPLVISTSRTIDDDGKCVDSTCDSTSEHVWDGIAGFQTFSPSSVQFIDNGR